MRLRTTQTKTSKQSGIASLPAILLLGSVIVEIAVASVLVLSYLNNSIYGARLNSQAFTAARAGINDAVSRIILNKNCGADTSCAPLYPDSYSLTVGSAAATISICKDTCAGSGKHQVISVGSALTRQRRLVAVLSVDSTTGLVSIDSIADQPQ